MSSLKEFVRCFRDSWMNRDTVAVYQTLSGKAFNCLILTGAVFRFSAMFVYCAVGILTLSLENLTLY